MMRLFAGGTFAVLLLAAAAPAAKPMPPFSATGSLRADVQASAKSGTFETDIRVLHAGSRTRADLLKIVLSTSDPNGNAMLAQMVPKGVLSIVVNQSTNAYAVWSSRHSLYFHGTFALPHAAPKNKTSKRAASPWTNVLKGLNALTQYDVLNNTFSLAGHQAVNGRPASLFRFTSQTQKHGGKLEDVTGELALADDLSGIPIHFKADATGPIAGGVQIDLASIVTGTPNPALLAPPRGYKRTKNFMEILSP